MPVRVVVSTVGISMLLKLARDKSENLAKRINAAANADQLDELLAKETHDLVEKARLVLQDATVADRRKLSAELNGLYGIYKGQLRDALRDIQILVTTDTVLGKQAADVIEAFLRAHDVQNVQVLAPSRLSGATAAGFAEGMKELINDLQEILPCYPKSHYRIVFNLTGGFKSLQGFMNIIGMFYADEIVYIFETGDSLLSIPRLPLRIDEGVLKQHAVELEMMRADHLFPADTVRNIPEGLLKWVDEDPEGYAGLSPWGTLVWNRVRDRALGENLLPFPYLAYSERFVRDFKDAEVLKRIKLQVTLAKVSSVLAIGNLKQLYEDKGLQYSNLRGHRLPDGRAIAHFRVDEGDRVTCVAEGKELHLRRFGPHSIIENP